MLQLTSFLLALPGGNVLASWRDAFFAELLQFPRGHCDDQADALSQYLNYVARYTGFDFEPTFGPPLVSSAGFFDIDHCEDDEPYVLSHWTSELF